MKTRTVKIDKMEPPATGELAETVHRVCAFCEKMVEGQADGQQAYTRLSGRTYHCPFCVRHHYHHRPDRVLALSYRAVIGLYYWDLYDATPPRMYFTEIEAAVERHAEVGLCNPVFNYDPETMLWFIDFSRVGDGQRKMPFAEVLHTAREVYDALGVAKRLRACHVTAMWGKYDTALRRFDKTRKRGKARRMLIPTFSGVLAGNDEFFEETRFFQRKDLVPN
jgi:hypothetical protein